MTDQTESLARLRALATEQAALRRVATMVAGNPEPSQVFARVCEEVGLVSASRAPTSCASRAMRPPRSSAAGASRARRCSPSAKRCRSTGRRQSSRSATAGAPSGWTSTGTWAASCPSEFAKLLYGRRPRRGCRGGLFLKRPGRKPVRIGRRLPRRVDFAGSVAGVEYSYKDSANDARSQIVLVRPGRRKHSVQAEGAEGLKESHVVLFPRNRSRMALLARLQLRDLERPGLRVKLLLRDHQAANSGAPAAAKPCEHPVGGPGPDCRRSWADLLHG